MRTLHVPANWWGWPKLAPFPSQPYLLPPVSCEVSARSFSKCLRFNFVNGMMVYYFRRAASAPRLSTTSGDLDCYLKSQGLPALMLCTCVAGVQHHFSECLGWKTARAFPEEWGDEMLECATCVCVCNAILVS